MLKWDPEINIHYVALYMEQGISDYDLSKKLISFIYHFDSIIKGLTETATMP